MGAGNNRHIIMAETEAFREEIQQGEAGGVGGRGGSCFGQRGQKGLSEKGALKDWKTPAKLGCGGETTWWTKWQVQRT